MSLMPFIQGKIIHELGSTVPPKQQSALPEGFWASASFTECWKKQEGNRS